MKQENLWLSGGPESTVEEIRARAKRAAEIYVEHNARQEQIRSERRTDFWFCAAILAVLAVNTTLVTVGAVVVSQWVLRVLH